MSLGRVIVMWACAAIILTGWMPAAQTQTPPDTERRAPREVQIIREVGDLIARRHWEEAVALARNPVVRPVTRASLLGYIALRANRFEEAAQFFEEALAIDPDRQILWVYLGQARLGRGEVAAARDALGRVRAAAAKTPVYWVLRARVQREEHQPADAYATLMRGLDAYPEDPQLLREAGLVLLAQGALGQARPYLVGAMQARATDEAAWQEAARIIDALVTLGHVDEAVVYLTLARWRFPDRALRLLANQAYLYAKRGDHEVAARLFAQASWLGNGAAYAFEAADQYRVARRADEALRWNVRVAKEESRLRQRFLILTEDARWMRAVVVGDRLLANGWLDARGRLRLGLAMLYSGDVAGARRQLSAMPEDESRAQLKEEIARCTAKEAMCF